MTTDVRNSAILGGLGAIAPDIVLFYSKRWTMPGFTFDPYMYVTATVLYVALAALVAGIYPYRREPHGWKAFSLGVALPVVISALASINRAQIVLPRGASVPGSFHDLFAWF